MSISHLLSGSFDICGSYTFKNVASTTETVIDPAEPVGTAFAPVLSGTGITVGSGRNMTVTGGTNPYMHYTGGVPVNLNISANAYIEAAGGVAKVVELKLYQKPDGGAYAEKISVVGTTPCALNLSLMGHATAPGDHYKLYVANDDDDVNLIVKNLNMNVAFK